MSKQELIAAQRAATRANQRAILSAQANSARGLDVLLPSNAMIRSSRYEVDDRMRYSYVEPDGETYDISDIVEKEWRNEVGPAGAKSPSSSDDLLHGVLARGKDGLGAKLDRVLSKIKHEKESGRAPVSQPSADQGFDSARSSTDSAYSAVGTLQEELSTSRTATPTARDAARSHSAAASNHRGGSPSVSRLSSYRTASPGESDIFRVQTATPTASSRNINHGYPVPHERQSSLASAMSDYRTATPSSPPTASPLVMPMPKEKPKLIIPRNDFGLNEMMAVIEMRAALHKKPPEHAPLDPVEEMLFGKPIDPLDLHPEIRNIYASTFKQLEEMDQVCLSAEDAFISVVANNFFADSG